MGLALWSIAASAALGAAIVTGGAIALRYVQGDDPVGTRPDLEFMVLSSALMFGLMVSAGTAAFALRKITDLWRRGVAGAVAVFGTVILSSVAAPLELGLGLAVLHGYFVLLIIGHLYLKSRAAQARAR